MVQWDKDSCGDAGFLKSTCSGWDALGGRRCIDEIARVRGSGSTSPASPTTTARSTPRSGRRSHGVFQIESRAQMQMLKRTRPETLDDLTVQVALVRPGPIIGGAVHPYIERREGMQDPGTRCPTSTRRSSLCCGTRSARSSSRTRCSRCRWRSAELLGRRGRAAAGDEPAASEAAIRAYEEKFVAGAEERGRARGGRAGLDADRGLLRVRLPEGAFVRLRAARLPVDLAAGALLQFLCSLLSGPMGFYPPDALVRGQRCGVEIRPPCAVTSHAECRVKRVQCGWGWASDRRQGGGGAPRHRTRRWLALARRPRRPLRGLRGDAQAARWAGACDALVDGEPSARRRQRYGCSAWPPGTQVWERALLACRSTRTRALTCAR